MWRSLRGKRVAHGEEEVCVRVSVRVCVVCESTCRTMGSPSAKRYDETARRFFKHFLQFWYVGVAINGKNFSEQSNSFTHTKRALLFWRLDNGVGLDDRIGFQWLLLVGCYCIELVQCFPGCPQRCQDEIPKVIRRSFKSNSTTFQRWFDEISKAMGGHLGASGLQFEASGVLFPWFLIFHIF